MTNPTDTVVTQRARHRLGEAVLDLARSRNRAPVAIRRIHNALPGYPTVRTGGNPPDDNTPDQWLSGDVAVVDLELVKTLTVRLQADARQLLNLFDKWAYTRHGSEADANPHDVGCVSCNRANHFAPRRPEGGDVCRWCADTLRAVNVVRGEHDLEQRTTLPLAAVQKRARGQRITATDIERWADAPTVATMRRAVRQEGNQP